MGAPKINQNPLLDKNFLNAFIEGVVKTLSMMANTEVKPLTPKIETHYSAKGEVTGMVGMVAGTTKGTLSISFSRDAIFEVLENMLGEKYTDINPEVADAVGEMTNQIYGCGKTTLNQLGYSFEMAIPSVISGTYTISKHHTGATLVIPFSITKSNAIFYVDITVQV
jgi:chemotaxis protein CheX